MRPVVVEELAKPGARRPWALDARLEVGHGGTGGVVCRRSGLCLMKNLGKDRTDPVAKGRRVFTAHAPPGAVRLEPDGRAVEGRTERAELCGVTEHEDAHMSP